MSVLKIECIGHLGKDATANTVGGKQVINFNVAHTESYKKQDGTKMQNTTWLSCSYWTDSTGLLPYLKKGTLVYIEGMPKPKLYEGKNGTGLDFGVTVFSVKLLAQPKQEGQDSEATGGAYVPPVNAAASAAVGEPIDDLPF